ncbi:MAG TPA: glycosyltransferase [Desulfomonilaceae bacterium]|nr:glycosyltransferase [Desulfomonilaceae bacterium]
MTLPKVAYILLWFPKASETFIFREVINLWKMGLPLKVYTLYGELTKQLSPEMVAVSHQMERLGIPYLKRAPADLLYWRKRDPETTSWLLRTIPLRKWRSLEVAGENVWAFFCGFTLARLFEADGIDHIHAPWANGPATAAWVASKLTGIPFSFMGRAVDIHPPDGALKEKIRDATFVRVNPKNNVDHLKRFAEDDGEKIFMTYDGYPIAEFREAPVPMKPPFQILALGRFARFKGFEVLIDAAKILEDEGLDFRLTIAGSGLRGVRLKAQTKRLRLTHRVSFPGFITYDRVSDLFCTADVFVMPSVIHSTGERDGIPNVLVEAMLHRLPVVATDVAGLGEVVLDGETGLLIPQRDPKALATAISRITSDRKASLEMAEKGRDLILKDFDPDMCHGQVLELFKKFGFATASAHANSGASL